MLIILYKTSYKMCSWPRNIVQMYSPMKEDYIKNIKK